MSIFGEKVLQIQEMVFNIEVLGVFQEQLGG